MNKASIGRQLAEIQGMAQKYGGAGGAGNAGNTAGSVAYSIPDIPMHTHTHAVYNNAATVTNSY